MGLAKVCQTKKAAASNFTAASFAGVWVATATKPTRAGFHELPSIGSDGDYEVPSHIWVEPYGSASDDNTLLMRVWGWNYDSIDSLWVPNLLAQIAVTLGNIAATTLGASNLMADTLVLTYGNAAIAIVNSPANNVPAMAKIDLCGATHVEFDFDRNSSAASGNALWRAFSQ